MCTFIEDYLQNPTLAILNARSSADCRFEEFECDDQMIYAQLSTPEFRLYEEITVS